MSSESLIQIGSGEEGLGSSTETSADKPGVYIRTFGCQMNEYDSDKLAKILEPRYQPVASPDRAELILVNTCSVREKPEHKLFSLLGELKKLKRENEKVLIGVGGCVAQQEGQRIVDRAPDVDFVFGTHNLSLVPQLIDQRRASGNSQVAIDYRDEWEELPLGYTSGERASVFVSISRGCNKNCAYCIVPTTRGKEVSRSPQEVLREVRIAAHRGAKEVVLLGQTVNSYGLDLEPRMKFVELLEQIAEIDSIKRIRFTSPHPQEVRQDFFQLCSENEKVCNHIHMPLQAGSDRILKLMNRNYRKARYLKIIEGLRALNPDIAITTDIIVGFPGETREEFEETLELMREVEFDNCYSFVYSARPGTIAADMEDPVPAEEKLRWLQELQALQETLTSKKLASYVGSTREVLLDGFSKHDPTILQGRTSENVMVNLNQAEPSLGPGMIVEVSIEAAHRFTLSARYKSLVDDVERPLH